MITRYYSIYDTKERKERSKEKKENSSSSSARTRGVDEAIVFAAGEVLGMTRSQCEEWLKYENDVTDWTFPNGGKVTPSNFKRSLRMWGIFDEELREKRQERKAEALARREIYEKKVAKRGGYFSSGRKSQNEIDRLRSEGEARQKAAEEKRIKELIQTPEAWMLCSEECENYDPANIRCTAGCPIPPQLRKWPIPPRECHAFKRQQMITGV